jgi:hypothetical protein
MDKSAERPRAKQGQSAMPLPAASLVQLLLPMVSGIVSTR